MNTDLQREPLFSEFGSQARFNYEDWEKKSKGKFEENYLRGILMFLFEEE